MSKKLKSDVVCVLVIVMAVLLFVYPDTVFASVSESGKRCFSSLLPSLFPMSVLSKQICPYIRLKKGKIAKVLSKTTGFSTEILPVFLTGLLCGYPLAAVMLKDMYDAGVVSKEDAKKAVVICNNASPAFLVFYVGKCVFGSPKIGFLLYLCQTAAIITTAHFWSVESDCRNDARGTIFPESLSASVSRSAKSFVELCGFVIFFSLAGDLLSEIASSLGTHNTVNIVISGMFETVSGISKASLLPFFAKFLLVCVFCIFGGLSVYFQISFCSGENLSDAKKYFEARLFVFVLTVFFAAVALFLSESSLL